MVEVSYSSAQRSHVENKVFGIVCLLLVELLCTAVGLI